MRIALFGGTFDPIHRGHLAIASAAADAFALDRVIFAPTGRQPLKSGPPVASFADRLAMVELAVEEAGRRNPARAERFAASAMDAPRAGGEPNYTIDLLTELRQSRPADWLVALTGADSFLTLRRWREPDRLLALAEWIVVSRPGCTLNPNDLAALELTPDQQARVHLLETVHEDVSATELRRRLAQGDRCEDLLPAAVAGYIEARGLYRP